MERQLRKVGFHAPDETTPPPFFASTAGRRVDTESTCAVVLHREKRAAAWNAMEKGNLWTTRWLGCQPSPLPTHETRERLFFGEERPDVHGILALLV